MGKLWAVLGHHHNEMTVIQRAVTARKNGLDPEKYVTPYPGTTETNTTIVHNHHPAPTPQAQTQGVPLWQAALLAAVSAAIPLGAIMLTGRQPTAPLPQMPPSIQQKPQAWKVDIFPGPDGKITNRVTPETQP